jgi:hypothetical protein
MPQYDSTNDLKTAIESTFDKHLGDLKSDLEDLISKQADQATATAMVIAIANDKKSAQTLSPPVRRMGAPASGDQP